MAERVGNRDMMAEPHPQLVHIPTPSSGATWVLDSVLNKCNSSLPLLWIAVPGGGSESKVSFATCNPMPGAICLYCLAVCCLHHKPWSFLPANGNSQRLLLISSKRETDIWWASIMHQPRCYTKTQMSRCISPPGAQSSWKRPEVGILFQKVVPCSRGFYSVLTSSFRPIPSKGFHWTSA